MSSKTATVDLSPVSIFGSKSLLDRADSSPGSQAPLSEIQSQTDHLVSTFMTEASNYKTLASLLGAGAAYRFTRIGAMASAAPLLSKSSGILPLFIRAGSYVPALAAESGVFAGMTREFTSLEGQRPTRSFERDWVQAAFSLGGLKLFGGMAQGQNIILQHLFADTGMVLGNHGASLAGVIEKPQGDLLTQFLHAEVLNLQMMSGMSLVHGLSPHLAGFERSVDFQLKSQEMNLQGKQQPFFLFPSLAAATANSGSLSKEAPGEDPMKSHSFMMEGGEDGGSGGELDVPRLKELAAKGNQSALSSLIRARETDPRAGQAADEAIETLRSLKRNARAVARASSVPPEESGLSMKSLFSFLTRQNVRSRLDLTDLFANPSLRKQAQRCLDLFSNAELERILFIIQSKPSIRERFIANSRLPRKMFEDFLGDFITILTVDTIASQGRKFAKDALQRYDVSNLAKAAEMEPQGVALLKVLAKHQNEEAREALRTLDTKELMEIALDGNLQAVSALAHLAMFRNRQAQQNITNPNIIILLQNVR